MFICPGCGDKVDENKDLIICDDCFQEAKAIREIRGKLVEIATPVMSGEQISGVTMDGEVLPPCKEEA